MYSWCHASPLPLIPFLSSLPWYSLISDEQDERRNPFSPHRCQKAFLVKHSILKAHPSSLARSLASFLYSSFPFSIYFSSVLFLSFFLLPFVFHPTCFPSSVNCSLTLSPFLPPTLLPPTPSYYSSFPLHYVAMFGIVFLGILLPHHSSHEITGLVITVLVIWEYSSFVPSDLEICSLHVTMHMYPILCSIFVVFLVLPLI